MSKSGSAATKIIKAIIVLIVIAMTGLLCYKAVNSGAQIEAFLQKFGIIQSTPSGIEEPINVEVGDKSEKAEEVLNEASAVFLKHYPNVTLAVTGVSVRSEIPNRDAVTQFEVEKTLDENDNVLSETIKTVNIIFRRSVFTDKDHDEQMYIMLHELAHAAASDTVFKEAFSEGMAEAIARGICEKEGIRYRTLFHKSAYDKETAAIEAISGGNHDFYLQYLLRNWKYFEEIDSVAPYFMQK